jgi:hypothetical protein
VRLKSSGSPSRVEGVVLAVDATDMTLASKQRGSVTIPVNSIQRLELRTGSKRNALKGLLIGAALGLAAGLAAESDGGCSMGPSPHSASRAESAAICGLGGALFGLGIGALIKSDVWTPIALPSYGGASAVQRHFALRVAISF